jgi:hypothetical protein
MTTFCFYNFTSATHQSQASNWCIGRMTVVVVHDQGQWYVVDSGTTCVLCETLAVPGTNPQLCSPVNNHLYVGIDRQRRLARRDNLVAECVDSKRGADHCFRLTR